MALEQAGDELDVGAVRTELEARRDQARARLAVLARRPERGAAQGFGKRIRPARAMNRGA